ncbi:MAG: ABC-2 family transporter protein, partial [Chthoniobacterales bacterium]
AIFWYFRTYITLPSDAITWLLAFVSLAMACAIQFLIAYSIAMLAFWILEISTVVFLLYSFEYFLSGRLFPLDIMPHGLQSVLKWLPFTYELYFPVAVFMQEIKGRALFEGLLIQAGWSIVLYFVAITMWRTGVRKYEAVGG